MQAYMEDAWNRSLSCVSNGVISIRDTGFSRYREKHVSAVSVEFPKLGGTTDNVCSP